MKAQPLCTIILPTIGRPKYFGAALASVAAQTYRPFNILISDNASNPPMSMAEIKKYAPEADVRLVRRPSRLTPPDSLKVCLQEVNAEYMFLMADDDLLAPDYINAGMKCMLSDSSVGIVVGVQTKVDEHFFGPIEDGPLNSQILSGSKFLEMSCDGKNPGVPNLAAMLVRREQLLEIGGCPSYPTGSYIDVLIFLQLCLGKKVGLVDGGYYYRVYPTSEGLAAPWQGLLAATGCFERDLLSLHQEGKLERKLLLAMIRSNTRLLFSRWKALYRRRRGFQNKARPILDLTKRIISLGWHYGLGAQPKLHRFSSDG